MALHFLATPCSDYHSANSAYIFGKKWSAINLYFGYQWGYLICQTQLIICSDLLSVKKGWLFGHLTRFSVYSIWSEGFKVELWTFDVKTSTKKLHSPKFYELGTPRPILPYCKHTAVGFPFPIRFKIFKVGPSRQTNTVGLIKTAIFQMTWRIFLHCSSSLERNWIFALSGHYINFDEVTFSCIITWNNKCLQVS